MGMTSGRNVAWKWLLSAAWVVGSLTAVAAAPWPYDETADAQSQVRRAFAAAHHDHRRVLLVFGANWCEDCRALDRAMQGSSASLIKGRFHVVKVDVGNFDKNLELSGRYEDPIKMGIPAVVLLNARGRILYSTKGGELANARRMGEQGIYDFLTQKLDTTVAH